MALLKQIGEAAESTLSKVGEIRQFASGLRRSAGQALEIDISGAKLFHGSSAWPGHALGPITTGGTAENLYGPGFYMTGHKGVAGEYALGKGAGNDPVRYGMRWRQKPNLIDLDKPFSPKVMRDVKDIVKGMDSGTAFKPLSLLGNYPTDRGGELIRTLFTGMGEQQLDIVQGLRKKGYHGFSHTGGSLIGNVSHRVNIAFDPLRDVEMVGHRGLGENALTASIEKARRLPRHSDPAVARIEDTQLQGLIGQRSAIISNRVKHNVASSAEIRAARLEASVQSSEIPSLRSVGESVTQKGSNLFKDIGGVVRGRQLTLNEIRSNHLGGVAAKRLFEDVSGDSYMFKHGSKEGVHSLRREFAANRLGLAVGEPVADMDMVNMPGTPLSASDTDTGLLQKMIPGTKSMERIDMGDVTDEHLGQLMQRHVFDIAIGNPDIHGGNYLVNEAGKIFGIDKGAAFHGDTDIMSRAVVTAKKSPAELLTPMTQRITPTMMDEALDYAKRIQSFPEEPYIGALKGLLTEEEIGSAIQIKRRLPEIYEENTLQPIKRMQARLNSGPRHSTARNGLPVRSSAPTKFPSNGRYSQDIDLDRD